MARRSIQEKNRLTVNQLTIQGSFESGSFSELRTTLQATLHALETTCVNVGVTGEQGSGKSTLINAIRGLGEDEEGAAPIKWTEAGREPTPYPHPKNTNVVLWDLPSIGTLDFQPKTYLEKIRVFSYDAFLILTDQRFTSCHAQVAKGIKEAGKGYYFVRTQVDGFLTLTYETYPSGFDEAVVLQRLRESSMKRLRAAGVESPEVFLVSGHLRRKYDFPHLEESLGKGLEPRKSRAFLLAAANTSHRLLETKKTSIAENMWLVSVVASSFNTVPIPGLSISCDWDLLVKTLQDCCASFGLDEASLRKVAEHIEEPFEELKALVKSPLATEISQEVVEQLLEKAAWKAPHVPKEVLSSAAIKESVAALGLSFPVVYRVLTDFVEEVAADAHRILVKVFVSQRPRSQSEDVAASFQSEDVATSIHSEDFPASIQSEAETFSGDVEEDI